MSITPIEMDIIGRNEEFFDDISCESEKDYISRKRKADLVSIVKKVLIDELSGDERTVLLEMETENKPARIVAHELNTSATQVYRIRSRAEKKVKDCLKYVLLYFSKYENRSLTPLEFSKALTLSKMQLSPCNSFAHRLRGLMAKECIEKAFLYRLTGLEKNAVDEIYSGKRLPDMNEIIALSYFLGISADYLLKGETS